MTVTANVDGFIRTHDEALDFLKAIAPGCSVEIERIRGERDERLRRYHISVVTNGVKEHLAHTAIYGLPFLEDQFRTHIQRELAKHLGK